VPISDPLVEGTLRGIEGFKEFAGAVESPEHPARNMRSGALVQIRELQRREENFLRNMMLPPLGVWFKLANANNAHWWLYRNEENLIENAHGLFEAFVMRLL
jgi:hypothetical protein